MAFNFRNCAIGKYHDFKVLSVTDKLQAEECRLCGIKKEYGFKPDGQMVDSEGYFKDHIRAFAQPSMRVYYDIHPGATLKFEAEEREKKQQEETAQSLHEKFQWAMKRAMENKGWKDGNRSSNEI